jgi:uncharacterized protein
VNTSNIQTLSRYRAPGVYLELLNNSTPSSIRTGVPVFVGFGKIKPAVLNKETHLHWFKISSLNELEQIIEPEVICFDATPGVSCYLRAAIRGFFENGGESCFVLPVPFPQNRTFENYIAALQAPFCEASNNPQTSVLPDFQGVLDDLDDIDLVCVPDLMSYLIIYSPDSDTDIVRDAVIGVQRLIMQHCERMGDRFAIFDWLPVQEFYEKNSRAVIEETIIQRFSISGSAGALYFPWISIHQGAEELKHIPPCGHIAGIYARTDRKIGAFKSPANEVIEGAFDLQIGLTMTDQAELNDNGVNCFKSSLSRGIRVWGARTLSVHSADRYIATKRLFLTTVRWIEANLSDLTFESNDDSLWSWIKYRLEGYCFDLFKNGALKGSNIGEAYYLKCDRETNNMQTRDQGVVVTEIGLACVVPAEFIIVRISQSATGIVTTALSLH